MNIKNNTYKIIFTGNGYDIFLDKVFNFCKNSKLKIENIQKRFIKNLEKLKNSECIKVFFKNLHCNVNLYQRSCNYYKKEVNFLIEKFLKFYSSKKKVRFRGNFLHFF